MPDDLDPCALLREADAAWFALNTSGAIRAVTDQNGERIEYSTGNRAGLLAYMRVLQAQCPSYQALALGAAATRPLKFVY